MVASRRLEALFVDVGQETHAEGGCKTQDQLSLVAIFSADFNTLYLCLN